MAQLTDKQRAGLAAGRAKGIKRKNTKTPNGTTWKDLIIAHGEKIAPNSFQETPEGKATWKQVVVRAAYLQAANGNAAILRELMARSEPQAEMVNVQHSGELELFNFAVIDRLIARRPTDDTRESKSD